MKEVPIAVGDCFCLACFSDAEARDKEKLVWMIHEKLGYTTMRGKDGTINFWRARMELMELLLIAV